MNPEGSRIGQTLALVLLICSACIAVNGQTRSYETNVLVETIAGSGFQGHLDGIGVVTMFNRPTGIAVDRMTNVYVWDDGNRCMRKITPDGLVTTFAGSGRQAREDGVGTNASFYVEYPYEADLIAGGDGSLYFANLGFIRKITPAGVVTTFAGNGGSGYGDGPISEAVFSAALGLAIDAQDNIFVADERNSRIRKISSAGIVTTIAGSGDSGSVDGVGIFSSFCGAHGIAVDPVGNIYVGERCASIVRRISPDGTARTFAGHAGEFNGVLDGMGTNATLQGLLRLACDSSGNIYTAEGSFVRKITPEGRVTTLAGGSYGQYADGEGPVARFGSASALAIDQAGRIWVADTGNNRIRRMSFSPVPVAGLGLALYPGLSVTGALGKSFRIEFTDSLTNSQSWTPASTITLTNSPTLWFDTSGVKGGRFYRAVLLP